MRLSSILKTAKKVPKTHWSADDPMTLTPKSKTVFILIIGFIIMLVLHLVVRILPSFVVTQLKQISIYSKQAYLPTYYWLLVKSMVYYASTLLYNG